MARTLEPAGRRLRIVMWVWKLEAWQNCGWEQEKISVKRRGVMFAWRRVEGHTRMNKVQPASQVGELRIEETMEREEVPFQGP